MNKRLLYVIILAFLAVAIFFMKEAIDHPKQTELTRAGDNIRKRIPDFPPYPQRWPKPAPDKGSYASRGERYMVETAEYLFHRPFIKTRPTWLQNPKTNRLLELDGFNEELGLALEYNGIQHYMWPNFTGQDHKKFTEQVDRDHIKRELCQKHGICLITTPYTVDLNDIPDYLYRRLIEAAHLKNEINS